MINKYSIFLCQVAFHMMIDDSYGPLIQSLPISLADHIGQDHACAFQAPHVSESHNAVGDGTEASSPGVGRPRYSKERSKSRGRLRHELDITHREQNDYGFAHPAAAKPQQIVWMAQDVLGLSAEEAKALQERGINFSTEDAEMDAEGNVIIYGPPPDGESRA
jgi:hypothetical protein